MNIEPSAPNSQPRPRSLALLPHLLPGPAQPHCAFALRTRPSLPCRSVNSVVHPPGQFSKLRKHSPPHASHLSHLSHLSCTSFPGGPSKLERPLSQNGQKRPQNGQKRSRKRQNRPQNGQKGPRKSHEMQLSSPLFSHIWYAFSNEPPQIVPSTRSAPRQHPQGYPATPKPRVPQIP